MESRTKTPHEMLLIKGLAKVALAPVDVEGAAANGPIALRDAGGRGILIGDGGTADQSIAVTSRLGMACAAEIPNSPWPATMSSSRLGCVWATPRSRSRSCRQALRICSGWTPALGKRAPPIKFCISHSLPLLSQGSARRNLDGIGHDQRAIDRSNSNRQIAP